MHADRSLLSVKVTETCQVPLVLSSSLLGSFKVSCFTLKFWLCLIPHVLSSLLPQVCVITTPPQCVPPVSNLLPPPCVFNPCVPGLLCLLVFWVRSPVDVLCEFLLFWSLVRILITGIACSWTVPLLLGLIRWFRPLLSKTMLIQNASCVFLCLCIHQTLPLMKCSSKAVVFKVYMYITYLISWYIITNRVGCKAFMFGSEMLRIKSPHFKWVIIQSKLLTGQN